MASSGAWTPADVTATVELITPEKAEQLLGKNVKNRHVRPSRVDGYARALRQDEWALNGETIKISDTGKLLDGQHRLMGVVESGKPAQFVVVRGLAETVQETIDTGLPRGLGDILSMRGEKNTTSLAAALKLAWRLEVNKVPFSGGSAFTRWPTNQELLRYLEDNPRIRDSVLAGEVVRQSILRYATSGTAALHHLMAKKDPEAADLFWSRLASGESLEAGDPILVLRAWLFKDLAQTSRRADLSVRLALTIKAWNAWREGRKIQTLRWSRGGAANEAFPTIE